VADTQISDRGDWASGRKYVEYDRVRYKGVLYVCKYPEEHTAAFANNPGSYTGRNSYWVKLAEVLQNLPESDYVPPFRERRILRIWFPDETYFKDQNVFFDFEIWTCLERAYQGESPHVAPQKWLSVQGSADTTDEGGGEGSTSELKSPPYPYYSFITDEPTKTWNLHHNLGCLRFYAEFYDNDGRQHFGYTVEAIDGANLKIEFSTEVEGNLFLWPLEPVNKALNEGGVIALCKTVPIFEADVELASDEWVIEHTLNTWKTKLMVIDEDGRAHRAFQKLVVNREIIRLSFESSFAGSVRVIPMEKIAV
jgi:hypothetical protein